MKPQERIRALLIRVEKLLNKGYLNPYYRDKLIPVRRTLLRLLLRQQLKDFSSD
jgi:hypothetical protein